MQQFVHGKCTSFTTLMELLNTQTVIHRLWLINSAQLAIRNSSQYVDHVMLLCLSLIMHVLAGGVDPGNFRNIFNVAK